MDQCDHSGTIVRFGVFEADLKTGELRKSGVRVPLPGQPFQVCALLLERPGELVTREELRQRIWPEDTFVDFDQALNAAVSKIRIALGDNADNPRFVETLPRRGYRFIAPLDKPISQELPQLASKQNRNGRTGRARWVYQGSVLLALLSGIGILRFSRNRAEAPLPAIQVTPLVGLPGFENDPDFSPDGNQVAFSLGGPEISGIHTMMVGGEKPLRLTSNPGDCAPNWSPDGRQIAFTRSSNQEVAIYVIAASGGTAHRLYSGPGGSFPQSLDWSPDGSVLAFSQVDADKTHSWIALLSVFDSTTRRFTSPSSQELDYSPSFSPD